jgi:hypothetical protein
VGGEASAAGVGSVVGGLVAMSTKLKVGMFAAATIGIVFVLWYSHSLISFDDKYDQNNISFQSTNYDGPTVKSNEGVAALTNIDHDKKPIKPISAAISGYVTDIQTGNPVQTYDFGLYGDFYDGSENELIRAVVNDKEGRFSFSISIKGNYSIRIRSSKYLTKLVKDIEITNEDRLINIALDPGFSVSGKVVDNISDKPIPNAIVGPAYSRDGFFLTSLWDGDKHETSYTTTDEYGIFTLSGFEVHDLQKIIAVHDDFAQGYVSLKDYTDKPIIIRLKKGYRVYGHVFDDNESPLAGEVVTMSDIGIWGHTLPSYSWRTRTDENGFYKTGQILKGKVVVSAVEEYKSADIIDRDVEVNFGPSQNHITWSGTLYGFDGRPVKRAEIKVESIRSLEGGRIHRTYYAQSTGEGNFELNKLLPGSYRVFVSIPGGTKGMRCGIFSFYKPGKKSKDIHLSGAEICGVIVDSFTGLPLKGKSGRVTASFYTHVVRRHYSSTPFAPIEPSGEFKIRGLSPGTYTLDIWLDHLTDYIFDEKSPIIATTVSGIKVLENETVSGLRIEVPSTGWLELNVNGFNDDGVCFHLSLEQHGNRKLNTWGYRHTIKDGYRKERHLLETGEWTAIVSFSEYGVVKKPFNIYRDQSTIVEISRDSFILSDETISMTGILTRNNGMPSTNTSIYFTPIYRCVPGYGKKSIVCNTDSRGIYNVDGLKSGCWSAWACINDTVWSMLDEFYIPGNSDHPYYLDLIYSDGIVSGRLCDGKSKIPLNDDGADWSISLIDVNTEELMSQFHGNSSSGIFELPGVPSGKYMIQIDTKAYMDYHSGSFYLAEGQNLDLGDFYLESAGLVDLEVVDSDGKAILNYTGTCDGLPLSTYWGFNSKTDTYHRYLVPLGRHTFQLGGEDYKYQEFTVNVNEFNEPVYRKVVLEPLSGH